MTLAEARKTLEQHKAWMQSSVDDPEPERPENEKVYEALDIAIGVLPKETKTRAPAHAWIKRLGDEFKGRYGLDPFNRSRSEENVAARQCVFLFLREEGYTCLEIGKATGYDHSTISFGCKQARDGLDIRDDVICQAWRRLLSILDKNLDY